MLQRPLRVAAVSDDDVRIKRARRRAESLAHAIESDDRELVEAVLTPLTREELYALAIVLAERGLPPDPEAELIGRAVIEAARRFGVAPRVVLGRARSREVVDARAVVCYVGVLLGLPYVRVGRHLNRDHSTVSHAHGRVGHTPRLRAVAEAIAAELGWNPELEAVG